MYGGDIATNSHEFLIFLLDGSGSMYSEMKTIEGKITTKWDILVNEVLGKVNAELAKSSKNTTFRFSFVVFGKDFKILEINENKFLTYQQTQEEGFIERISKLSKEIDADGTSFNNVLGKAAFYSLLKSAYLSNEFSMKRKCTIFFFTDGKNTGNNDEIIEVSKSIRDFEFKEGGVNGEAPKIATISFGTDANADFLKQISSKLSEDQKRQFINYGIILPDENIAFIKAHDENGMITKDLAKKVRNFAVTISISA